MKNAAPARSTIADAPLTRGVVRSTGGFSGITETPPLAAVRTAGSRPPDQGVGKGALSSLCPQQSGRPDEQEDHEEDERHALRIAGRKRRVPHGELLGECQQ